ncbi:MAG: GNAT family N-acetyltransferase [Bacteroidales bacterium]|jgi:GNAT superfamily N-acetyltransferase|nr:GNAT family N-acetyltransferase [Bacteroidales bacterium]
MTKKIVIAPAKEADLSQMVDFQLEMALETEGLKLDSLVLERGITSALKDSSKANYFVAQINDKPVGMLMLTTEWSDWRNGWVWWIQSVYVIPEMRKEGVFGALYSYVKQLVISRKDVMGIRLYVDKRNSKAQRVYEAVGMTGEHYSTYEWMKEF